MDNRIDRHTYFMEIAKLVAKRSTCTRAQVGTVLVAHKKIIATGYNGSTPGGYHCTSVGCLIHDNHCIRTVHSELNAILNLEHNYREFTDLGVSLRPITAYCTHQPCLNCTKAIITANVGLCLFLNEYPDHGRDIFLKEISDFTFRMEKFHVKS